MRKNAPRKWIHAILDLLPILIIPIFAININQKSVEPISIEVQEKISVDFNQLNLDNYKTGTVTPNGQTTYYTTFVNINLQKSNTYLVRCNMSYSGNKSKLRCYCQWGTIQTYGSPSYDITPLDTIQVTWKISNSTYDGTRLQLGLSDIYTTQNLTTSDVFTYDNLIICNLNEMGLETLSVDEFNTLFSDNYYPYTESKKMLVDKPTPTTYDDTDIGSQFLYSLYKPVKDYFNFNNLFNMNDVWQWIQLNLFQGTAPLPVFMVWNIILYEFFMDLIFLLYAVFMFVIDFATCMIDSFMGKARKGV